jgi:phage-related protein (TIGR01555 family)
MTLTTLADNQGLLMINRASEEFDIKHASLAGVPEIVKQSMERMTLPARMPIVKFFGNQPSGLNADSEGVIRMWYDDVRAMQEARNREIIQRIIELCEIELWGEIIDDIVFEFNGLWQLDDAGKAAIQKTRADARAVDISAGIITQQDGRRAALADKDSQYTGLDLSQELPMPQGGIGPSGEPRERGENPNVTTIHPTRRDFGESLTTQAARFGGAMTGGFSSKE